MTKRSTWFGSVSWLAIFSQLALVGCGDDPKSSPASVTLKGRVFSADDGKALEGVELGLGDAADESDERGRFQLDYAKGKAASVTASGDKYASTSKQAPESGGYLELFSKKIELEAEVDLKTGGELETKSGLHVKIDPNSFKKEDGSPAKKAKIKLARADLSRVEDIQALPGKLDTNIDGKKGKFGVKEAFYVSATDEDGKPLAGKIKVAFKVSDPSSKAVTREELNRIGDLILLRSQTVRTVLARDVRRSFSELMESFFELAELLPVFGEAFFAIGDNHIDLGCVRACVKDEDGDSVSQAQVTATVVGPALIDTEFSDADGCVAFSLPKILPISTNVRVVAEQGFWQGEVNVQPTGSIEDPSTCQQLSDIVLSASDDSSECPAGYLACGDACLDPSVHSDCDDVGGEGPDGRDASVGGESDAGDVDPGLDASVGEPDGGVIELPDAGTGGESDAGDVDPGLDASTGVPDAGVNEPDASTGEPDAGDPLLVITYYIDRELGQDSNTGLESNAPLRTITAALARLNTGVWNDIQVSPGTYDVGGGEVFPLVLPANTRLFKDPAKPGPATISGSQGYSSEHTLNPIFTAVVLHSNAQLSGFRVQSGDQFDDYGVVVEGAAIVEDNTFAGLNGVRILWDNPDVRRNQFEVERYGVGGCKGGRIEDNDFVGGATQIEAGETDLCIIEHNRFTNASDIGVLVSGLAEAQVRGNTFTDSGGYSVAAVALYNDAVARLRQNDFSGLGAGHIVRTMPEGSALVDLGTIVDSNFPDNTDSPGENIFPADEPVFFEGVRLLHSSDTNLFAYGNDWGAGRTTPVCGSDIQVESSGFVVWAEEPCNVPLD